MWLGDGPYREEHLAEKMLGRMIGIYQSNINEPLRRIGGAS
jgi:hypothetical protein